MRYRVVWRELRSWEWQTREFGPDREAACRFHRQQQAALKASKVQWWSEAEQLWIG